MARRLLNPRRLPQSLEVANDLGGAVPKIDDAPWPGFTPDLMSIVLVTATQARGSVLVHQKMFESRLLAVLARLDRARPVYVEGESRKIGALRVPEALIHSSNVVTAQVAQTGTRRQRPPPIERDTEIVLPFPRLSPARPPS